MQTASLYCAQKFGSGAKPTPQPTDIGKAALSGTCDSRAALTGRRVRSVNKTPVLGSGSMQGASGEPKTSFARQTDID